jgi:hypothetical protein
MQLLLVYLEMTFSIYKGLNLGMLGRISLSPFTKYARHLLLTS